MKKEDIDYCNDYNCEYCWCMDEESSNDMKWGLIEYEHNEPIEKEQKGLLTRIKEYILWWFK